ncbi:MAG: hypothetical protein RL699_2013 [Bacteroidota bacterium]|jgi:hypothetical protein
MRFSNECLTIGFKDFTHIYNLRSEKIASSFLLAMTFLVYYKSSRSLGTKIKHQKSLINSVHSWLRADR